MPESDRMHQIYSFIILVLTHLFTRAKFQVTTDPVDIVQRTILIRSAGRHAMSESKASYDGESDLKDPDLSRAESVTSDAAYAPVRSIVLNSQAPYPHRSRRHQRSLTIQEHVTGGTTKEIQGGEQRGRDLRIQRTNSISLASGPMKGDREARTVADFRTLSLGVKDTQRSEGLGDAQRRGKKEVKGWSLFERGTARIR